MLEPRDMDNSTPIVTLHETQMFWTNQQDRPAEDEQEWPSKTDDAPGRLIFDYAVGNQAAHTVDRQITQIEILQLLAKCRHRIKPASIGSS